MAARRCWREWNRGRSDIRHRSIHRHSGSCWMRGRPIAVDSRPALASATRRYPHRVKITGGIVLAAGECRPICRLPAGLCLLQQAPGQRLQLVTIRCPATPGFAQSPAARCRRSRDGRTSPPRGRLDSCIPPIDGPAAQAAGRRLPGPPAAPGHCFFLPVRCHRRRSGAFFGKAAQRVQVGTARGFPIGGDVERGGAVAHRACHHMVGIEAAGDLGEKRPDRVEARGRLEAEDTAAGCESGSTRPDPWRGRGAPCPGGDG